MLQQQVESLARFLLVIDSQHCKLRVQVRIQHILTLSLELKSLLLIHVAVLGQYQPTAIIDRVLLKQPLAFNQPDNVLQRGRLEISLDVDRQASGPADPAVRVGGLWSAGDDLADGRVLNE